MKIYLILFLNLLSVAVNTQDLSDREIAKLDLEYSIQKQNDFQYTNQLRTILETEKQRKSNRLSGIILISLSAIKYWIWNSNFFRTGRYLLG